MARNRAPSLPRVSLLRVSTAAGSCGRLAKNGQHSFVYDTDVLETADRHREISLTMPLRPEAYVRTPMLPVFETFMPEGFLRDRMVDRFGKVMRVDDMALLLLSNANAIGRLRVSAESGPEPTPGVESLEQLLADQGSGDLFADLCDRYLIGSGVAGVQPKVLVAARDDVRVPRGGKAKASLDDRSTLRAHQYIVKADSPEFPDLAVNEFHCLSVASAAGLSVPAFQLSRDRKRLVVQRFDYDFEDDRYLGFEDMVALQGKTNATKYEGTYEQVARTIAMNASPAWRARSLHQYFAGVVASVALGNGDAHLKNFGLLYTDPASDDCRLSPVFDVVCTLVYLPRDRLALSLDRSRAWPDRAQLLAFGRQHCEIDAPDPIIDTVLAAADDYEPAFGRTLWKRMRTASAAVVRALR